MKLLVKKDTTDVTVYLFIQDSSVTTGAGLTGLTYNASGLVCYYVRPLAAAAALTLATQTVTGAHGDGGFVEVSSANMPGVYRLDLSDAICATGVNSVVVMLKGATNMAPVTLEIQLVSIDVNDAVRAGLTALPNAAAQASGGLYTRGTGAGQINQAANGQIDVNVEAWNATAVPAEYAAGYPIVCIKDGSGNGEINTDSGRIMTVNALENSASAGDLTATMKASINAEVDAAIADARLDELLAADSDIDGAAPPTVGSVIHELMSKTAGSFTFDQTTDSLEAVRDRGDAAWITATGFSTHSAADVWAVGTRTLTSFGTLVADVVTAIWDALTSGLTTVGSIGKLLVDNVNATISSRASQTSVDDLPTNAELATALAAADDATLAAIAALNDVSAAEVNAEVDTALADIHLDHLLAADYDPASKPGTATALLNELIGNDAGVSQFTANALELAPTGGSAPTVGQIADEVQTRTIAGVTTVTNLTNAPTAGDLTATMKASVNAEVDSALDTAIPGSPTSDSVNERIKTLDDNFTATVAGRIDAAITTRSSHSVADIWNALTSGMVTAGSIGKRIIDYLTGDAFARLGAPAGASVSADVAAIKSDAAAILLDTGTDGVVVAAASKTGYELSATGNNAAADALLKRDVDQVEATAPVHSLTTVALAVASKVADDGLGNVVVYRTNGTTAHMTKAITTDAALDPIKTAGVGA